MQSYKYRIKQIIIQKHLKSFPCVVLLGARQVGKSTLAKEILKPIHASIYLDLEDPRDFAKLQDPMAFLEALKVIKPDHALVIAQINNPFPIKKNIWVYNLESFLTLTM